MMNLWDNHKVMLCEKSHCEFAIGVLRKTGGSSMLNKIANHTYKARSDWLGYFSSPWESTGYIVESPNDQLRLTLNTIWAIMGAVIIANQETVNWSIDRMTHSVSDSHAHIKLSCWDCSDIAKQPQLSQTALSISRSVTASGLRPPAHPVKALLLLTLFSLAEDGPGHL